ncbi:hypothetical protein HYV22_00615, partial [Candidatus Gottesmanbacteria bacterium]|nr:hypothetical protein [Candidatus Gottesmanbacteria bacterium]
MRQGQERIIIANLAETFYDFVNLDTNHFASALAIEQSIEEQGVFWAGNNSIVVTSKPLHPLHQQHLSRSLGYTNLVLHSPSSRSGRLSTDIVGDQDLLQRLIEPSAHNDLSMVVSPYCVTPEFVSLIENMIQGGAKITVPELPERENLWTVKNIDLKSGFRQVSRSLMSSSDIRIPEGFSCADLGQAMTVAHLFSKGGVECIIKPDNGEDGMGHVRIPAGSDINFIVRQIESNPFFRHGLVVVERYIKSDINIISPSIEYYVKDGKPLYLYSCAQTLSNTRTFLGVEVGSSVLPESIRVQMIRMGNAFGHVLGQLGYKGFFDIDFIVDEEQAVYAVE